MMRTKRTSGLNEKTPYAKDSQNDSTPSSAPLYAGPGATQGKSGRDWKRHAKTLLRDGYVVFPLLSNEETRRFRDGLGAAPEVPGAAPVFESVEGGKTTRGSNWSRGGFGGGNLPSLNHHPYQRILRAMAAERTAVLFRKLSKLLIASQTEKTGGSYNASLQQLFDRWVLRYYGAKPTAESWHRDTSPRFLNHPDYSRYDANRTNDPGMWNSMIGTGKLCETNPGNVFGSFFGSDDRTMCLVPGSHLVHDPENPTFGKGFDKFSKEQQAALGEQRVNVFVPAGSMIVFFQSICHEVNPQATKVKPFALWLHCVFNLLLIDASTAPATPPEYFGAGYADLIMNERSLSMLPSGQNPRTYPKLGWVFGRQALEKFSMNFDPRLITDKPLQTTGEIFRVVPEAILFAPWIRDSIPAYTESERAVMLPHYIE